MRKNTMSTKTGALEAALLERLGVDDLADAVREGDTRFPTSDSDIE
jgi:hypothetical protein